MALQNILGDLALDATLTDNSQKSQIINSAGSSVDIATNPNTGSNEMLVTMQGHVCSQNSTVVPLGIGGVFTGSGWQDTLDYGVISINISTDVSSATNGLQVQWSDDGITLRDSDIFSILGTYSKTFTFGPANRYVRLVYTNGSVAQTTFSLQTILRKVYVKPSSHKINDIIVGQDDAELVKSVLTAMLPNGNFTPIDATAGGNLKVSIEEQDPGAGLATSAKQLPDGHTVALSATDNAVLDAIEADTTTMAAGVVGGHYQVDILTMPAGGAGLTDAELRATAVPVAGATIPSHAVTNAGTFAVQATLQAASGVDIGKLTANQSVNNAQINGVTPLMGAGNTGTGSQRVTIASDNAAVASKAAINTYVDGSIVTIGAKADAKSTATDTTAVTMMQVMKQISASVQAPPSQAVTNAGTFAVQIPVITGIGHGVKTVTTAGTDVALAASTACKKVTIQAQTDNTSIVAVGGSGVDATVATGTGIVLNPGDAYEFEIDNLADVYIDSLVSGEGVRFTYFT
jgi:hypothetical protein